MAKRQLVGGNGKRATSGVAEAEGCADAGREEIACVAYELFEHRGGCHGRDLEDWLDAEAIVRQRHASPPGERRTDFL